MTLYNTQSLCNGGGGFNRSILLKRLDYCKESWKYYYSVLSSSFVCLPPTFVPVPQYLLPPSLFLSTKYLPPPLFLPTTNICPHLFLLTLQFLPPRLCTPYIWWLQSNIFFVFSIVFLSLDLLLFLWFIFKVFK